MTRARLRHRVRRMNDAAERLDERCCGSFQGRTNLDRIHRRHRNELCEPAGQASDAVFAIKLTLVTVVSAAVFTKNVAPSADAIQALVHHDAITFAQIRDRTSHLFRDAGDLVSENLRLQGKRNWLAVLIRVVVCVTSKDVDVSSAKSDCCYTYQNLVRRDHRARYVAHFETMHVAQDARLHRVARSQR